VTKKTNTLSSQTSNTTQHVSKQRVESNFGLVNENAYIPLSSSQNNSIVRRKETIYKIE
jgi:hypothetical protein